MGFYTLVGTDLPSYHVDRIELDDGREILLGLPVNLSEEEVDGLRARHLVFEETSAEDAEAVESAFDDWLASQPVVGDDVTGTAPLIGGSQTTSESAHSGTDTPSKEVK